MPKLRLNSFRADDSVKDCTPDAASSLHSTYTPKGSLPIESYSGLLDGSPSKADDEASHEYTFTLENELKGYKNILFTKFNALLLFIPFGIYTNYTGYNAPTVFALNFIALLPLASILGSLTEDIALHTGDVIGGLLNATFGNAIEMIITVQSIRKGLIEVVQGALLGSVISNLLLVLGMAFFCGGVKHTVQKFNVKGATCATSLLLLSSVSICIPSIVALTTTVDAATILNMSRGSAIIIGLTYLMFLFFQLFTHLHMFKNDDEEKEAPTVSVIGATILLLLFTILIAYLSEFLVSSINSLVDDYGISEGFIGVILLPIVGNAAEHISAVTVAIRNKVDLTMGIAVGSSVQVALFLVPFTVVVGWILNQPMTLAFPPVSAFVLLLSVFVVIEIINDGESNWLEGIMLLVTYCLVALAYWYV